MLYQFEILWNGKWVALFAGDYKTLAEYQKQCTALESRIVPFEKKSR